MELSRDLFVDRGEVEGPQPQPCLPRTRGRDERLLGPSTRWPLSRSHIAGCPAPHPVGEVGGGVAAAVRGVGTGPCDSGGDYRCSEHDNDRGIGRLHHPASTLPSQFMSPKAEAAAVRGAQQGQDLFEMQTQQGLGDRQQFGSLAAVDVGDQHSGAVGGCRAIFAAVSQPPSCRRTGDPERLARRTTM